MAVEFDGEYSFPRAFSRYGEYLSDISEVDYTCGTASRLGFGEHTSVFNDNITVCMTSGKEMHKMDSIICRAAIREFFGDQVGIMRGDNGRCADIRFCISTSLMMMSNDEVLSCLQRLLRKHTRLKLCDIDFTIDCRYITTRQDVLAWLPPGTRISDRRNTTGNNCISWFEDNGKRRCKEYNKTAQVKESAGARETIGSSLHVLMTDNETASTALRFKESGVTRLEVTFYSSNVMTIGYYIDTVIDLYRRMQTCKTYEVSLEQQWDALAAEIKQMMCMYHVPSSTFAYCHWWNSLTGKMQGGSKVVKSGDLSKVMSHYGFLNRPIYLVTVRENNGVVDEEVKLFRRAQHDENITLIAGPRGGLYPNTKEAKKHALSDFGMGVIEPGYIGWKDNIRSTSKAFLGLVEDTLESDIGELETFMTKLNINTKNYKAANKALDKEKEYRMIGYGKEKYGKGIGTFAMMSDGTCVRCEKTLAALIDARVESGNLSHIRFVALDTPNRANVFDTVIKILD